MTGRERILLGTALAMYIGYLGWNMILFPALKERETACLYVSGHAACGMEAGGGAVCGVGYRCRVYEIRPHVQKSKLLFRLYLDPAGLCS